MIENEKSILISKEVVKRILEILLLALWLYSASVVIQSITKSDFYNANEEETVVRVIANSNHPDDQYIKQTIVNEVISDSEGSTKLQIDEEMLEKEFPEVEWKLASGNHLMPPKLSNNQFFPQQQRDMVQLSIGDARGDNWFCALFYKACGYSSKDKVKETKAKKKKKKKKSRKKWWLF